MPGLAERGLKFPVVSTRACLAQVPGEAKKWWYALRPWTDWIAAGYQPPGVSPTDNHVLSYLSLSMPKHTTFRGCLNFKEDS